MSSSTWLATLQKHLFQISDIPSRVSVELNNECNLRCPMCPRDTLPVTKKEMPLQAFQYIAKKLAGWNLSCVDLGGWGEISYHSQFPELLQTAAEANLKFSFTTNGLKMSTQYRQLVIAAKPAAVTFSLDTLQPENKNFYGHFNLPAYNNLKAFVQETDDFPIKVNTMVQHGNQHSILDMIDELDQVGVAMVVLFSPNMLFEKGGQRLEPWPEYELFQTIENCYRQGRWKMIVSSPLGRYNGDTRHYWFRHGILCPAVFEAFYINVNGFVTPCCIKPGTQIAHISELENLADFWFHKKLKYFRFQQRQLCGNCDAMKYRPPLTTNPAQAT